ncbi:hypothetical protein DMA11_18090 [Marinilabiliaceae bacterium JC017]|nr:hypothetical protein DMA11_18090 [Marinilabiliaceae bacterium JC017]
MTINNNVLKPFLLYVSLLCSLSAWGQTWKGDSFRLSMGVVAQFGTHIQRLGLMLQASYYQDWAQVNAGTYAYYNFRGPGTDMPSWEVQMNAGGHFVWGSESTRYNRFNGSLDLQAPVSCGIGYIYKYYWDNKGTRQPAGVFALRTKAFRLVIENDVFSGQGEDKYRTAGVTLSYSEYDTEISLVSWHWTGNTHEGKLIKDSDYPSRFGYKDLSEACYGKTSHGILALRWRQNLGWGQVGMVEGGLDSEWIRHALQNKLIHDMPFVPVKWNGAENPHIPMLQENGLPYRFQPGEQVKKAKLFFQAGLNGMEWY